MVSVWLLRSTVLGAAAYLLLIAAEPGAIEVPSAGLLWRIERDDLEPSYLFGTMHVTDQAVISSASQAERLMENSRVLLSEVHGGSFELIWLPDGTELAQLLPPSLHRAAREIAIGDYGIPPQSLERLQMWFLADLFGRDPRDVGLVGDGIPILDFRLQQLALEWELPIVGLQTLSEVYEVAAALDLDHQIRDLRFVVANHNLVATTRKQYIALYLAGDLRAIDLRTRAALLGAPAWRRDYYYDYLVIERNYIMLKSMLPELMEGRAFVAVGTAHLGGEEGLIVLLRRLGWTVTRAD